MKLKRTIFFLLIYVAVLFIYAEDRSVKIDGSDIVLHDDFTWEYLDVEKKKESPLLKLNYNPSNTNELISKNNKYLIHVNSDEWIQTTGLNDGAQFQFVNSESTGYGMLIYEGLQFPLESLKEAMIINANNIDPNARIINEEKCVVNNTSGELVTYTANYTGMNFIFYSYITSSDKGTIQFTFYTLENAFDELEMSFRDAISGLEIIE